MVLQRLTEEDRTLIEAARQVLRRNYRWPQHTVGAAVRCPGGVYVGINVEACGYGPCAEPVAVGAAFTAGERDLLAIVAVGQQGDQWPVVSPCGNCRQLLLDYAPQAWVILAAEGEVGKARVEQLLPASYRSSFDE